MFNEGTMVAWATERNTFMGRVVESNYHRSIVEVTSSAKGRKWDGKKVSVDNRYLGDISSGRTVVNRA